MLIDGIFSHSQQAQSWHLVPGFCPRVQAQLSLVMANPIAASGVWSMVGIQPLQRLMGRVGELFV